jgi:DivIVA domain-containing protein
MTPDDIRHASFDQVRKGVDPEQVRDLLARVAFLLEKSPHVDLDELDAPDAALIDLNTTRSAPLEPIELAVTAEPVVQTTPAVDHRQLAERIGSVISAAQELVAWKAELERTADPVALATEESLHALTRAFDDDRFERIHHESAAVGDVTATSSGDATQHALVISGLDSVHQHFSSNGGRLRA